MRQRCWIPTSDAGDKVKIETKKKNARAMAGLSLAFTSAKALKYIYGAITPDWPGGLAYLVMEAVEKKYAPKDRMTTVDAHKKLFRITMKTREDPTNIFEKISEIEMSHNTTSNKLDDSLLIAVVMKVVPIEYASVVSAAMDKYGDKMTLDNLETELSKHYRVLSAKWKDGSGKDQEVNLSSVDAGQ